MPPLISIRPATTPPDLDHICALFRTYADYLVQTLGFRHICLSTYAQEVASLPGRYALPAGTLLLACVGDVPAGCIALQPVPAHHLLAPDASAAELKRLFVLPQHRGHQLGARLIQSAMAHARAQRYAAVYLDTVPTAMPHANAVYTALGFQPAARYNHNPLSDVQHYRLALTK